MFASCFAVVVLATSSALAQTSALEPPTTTAAPPTTVTCQGRLRSSCQATSGCYWCPVFGQGNNGTCHQANTPSGSSAPPSSDNFVCPYCEHLAKAVGVSCLQLDDYRCTYCYSNQKCMMVAAQGCPSCSSAQSSTQCATFGSTNQKTLPGCQWCALSASCYNPINYQSSCHCSALQRDQCFQFPQQCQYCSAIDTCQSASQACERCSTTYETSTCNALTGCSWCALTNQCYNESNSNVVCPAACADIVGSEDNCNAAPNCQYCASQSSCLPMSMTCNSCSSWLSQSDCSSFSSNNNNACSWCAMTATCQIPSAYCPTTCGALTSSYMCNVQYNQCSYCYATTSCQSVDDYCPVCSSHVTEDGCNDQYFCSWCALSNQCRSTSGNGKEFSCPSSCSDVQDSSTSCNNVAGGGACAWCYSDGSFSSGSGEQQCYEAGFCTSNPNLTAGAIAGIVVGAIVFVGCSVTLCVCCRRRRRAAEAAALAAAAAVPSAMDGTPLIQATEIVPGAIATATTTMADATATNAGGAAAAVVIPVVTTTSTMPYGSAAYATTTVVTTTTTTTTVQQPSPLAAAAAAAATSPPDTPANNDAPEVIVKSSSE